MLINHNEYQLMFDAEERLWWYRILHEKVVSTIKKKYGGNTKISLLDAGCGTGGLMQFLKKNGYNNIKGFDYSASAVHFSTQRGHEVTQLSIDDILEHFPEQSFDVIISNDVIYALEYTQIQHVFVNVSRLLKPNGLFISNNNAFTIFKGTHDIAVGSKHRFTLKDIQNYAQLSDLRITKATYWSLVLAPLILIVRLFQQFQLRFRLIDESKLVSDVSVPPAFINNFLYWVVKTEEKLLEKSFFGSSLFTIFKKVN